MSFSRGNMQKEFKRSSLVADWKLFFTKESFEELFSASQLVIGISKYSLCAMII